VPIEIQIRTREMEELANKGIAAHWLYKSDGEEKRNNHARARQWVQGLLELQKNAGNSLEFIENVKIDLFPDEVYVFSPKGRILELPKGATPVDFAYAIHTDVGSSCMACRVNRRMAPLSQPLESGATVEIITSPTARPSPSWLNFVVTGKARTHIRHALKQQQREESVTLGARLLEKALDAQGTKLADIEQSRIQVLLDEYQQDELDDLLESIGLGSRTAHLVARRLLTENTADFCSTAEAPLVIHGTEGMVLNYARCCTPIPGDPIVGHLSAGKGMVVHRDNCKNVADIRNQPEKCIPLSWAKDIAGEFSVDLRIELAHQRGLIALLAATVSEANANIEKISVDERDGRMSIVQLSISLGDRVHLARVMRKLRSLAGVTRIIRNKA
ncbi:MAG: TGS domain-containing protein, partial [Thiopseudomonas sp.]|nr:TGS domain-containing protein [Thiopseudomonas sp.]